MKKFIAFFLCTTMVFTLAACGSSEQTQSSAETTSMTSAEEVETEQEEDAAADAATDSTGSKTPVVYYSATGSTKAVAQTISDTAGADLFELEPVEPYTSDDLDWTDDNSRVSREHENEEERNVPLAASTVDNWEEYDTIFIGYPIWLAYHNLIQCTQA